MGQRSQIYIRETINGKTNFIARYYGWNYGSRMVSRCRYTLEWLKEYSENCLINGQRYSILATNENELVRILDTNFDMVDVVISQNIIEEYYNYYSEEDFNEAVFFTQDNNNGKLLIDITEGVLKYAFLNYDADSNYIMNAEQYMNWDYTCKWRENEHLKEGGEIKYCDANFPVIEKLAKLMTKEEVENFLSFDYKSCISKPKVLIAEEAKLNAYKELILEINNSQKFECIDIDNPTFIEFICNKMKIQEWEYRKIMKQFLILED